MSRKIFCIGWNKTATTSLEHALIRLKYEGPDKVGMELLKMIIKHTNPKTGRFIQKHELKKNLDSVVNEYDYFIDYPWFYKNLYKFLDQCYPDSLFILTVSKFLC